jgi:hypothetical protein
MLCSTVTLAKQTPNSHSSLLITFQHESKKLLLSGGTLFHFKENYVTSITFEALCILSLSQA